MAPGPAAHVQLEGNLNVARETVAAQQHME